MTNASRLNVGDLINLYPESVAAAKPVSSDNWKVRKSIGSNRPRTQKTPPKFPRAIYREGNYGTESSEANAEDDSRGVYSVFGGDFGANTPFHFPKTC